MAQASFPARGAGVARASAAGVSGDGEDSDQANSDCSSASPWRAAKAVKDSPGRHLGAGHGAARGHGDAAFAAVAAAYIEVEARTFVLRRLHPGGQKPDIADEVLGAGMRATGEMDVDRGIEDDAAFQMGRDGEGGGLGRRHAELAAFAARAGHQSRGDGVGFMGQA
jgi:hypothetical protein